MTRYWITEEEKTALVLAAGDVVRGAFGRGNMEKAEKELDRIERAIESREMNPVTELVKMLKADPDYRFGWQSNIAMAFVDTVRNKMDSGEYGRSPMNWEVIHEFANTAADRFLKQLEIDLKTPS